MNISVPMNSTSNYLPLLAQSPWLEPWLEPLQFRMTTSCDDKSEKNEKTQDCFHEQ